MARSLLSRLTCITLTSAKPRVTTWLPFQPFWLRPRFACGRVGCDRGPFENLFTTVLRVSKLSPRVS